MITIFQNQKGALFGLDARIAMGVFAAITVMVGAYSAMSMSKIRAQALADELNGMKAAIEGMHLDIQAGVHGALEHGVADEEDKGAFMALYTKTVLQEQYVKRWLGPYIDIDDTVHSKFGKIRLTRMMDGHTVECGEPCFLWLTYEIVPKEILDHLNVIFDGESEKLPEAEGRIQWSGSNPYKLWYRVAKAVN